MRLFIRCSYRKPGYYCNHWNFQDQVRQLVVVLACLFSHLALFQSVDASLLPFGSDNYNATPKGRSRGQMVIASVPEEDRGMFVVYHLARALNSVDANGYSITLPIPIEAEIPQKKSLTFKDIWTYNTFSADLLKWTMQTFECSEFDVYNLFRRHRILCTSNGLCFNPNDIGSMCCPF